jgi:hypothetical protein
MVKVLLSINDQARLYRAYSMLDGYEAVVEDGQGGRRAVRVPYTLGAVRQAVVRNMTALKRSIEEFDQVKLSLLSECFPEAKPTAPVQRTEANAAAFDRLVAEIEKVSASKDEIDLRPIQASAIYGDNDFPVEAIVALEEFGLVAQLEAVPA